MALQPHSGALCSTGFQKMKILLKVFLVSFGFILLTIVTQIGGDGISMKLSTGTISATLTKTKACARVF